MIFCLNFRLWYVFGIVTDLNRKVKLHHCQGEAKVFLRGIVHYKKRGAVIQITSSAPRVGDLDDGLFCLLLRDLFLFSETDVIVNGLIKVMENL